MPARPRSRTVDAAEVARRAGTTTLEGRIYARLPGLVEEHRTAIAARFPPYWRRAGGYRLDRLADGPPFNLARFVVGSEGTLVIVTEATVRLVPLPRAKAIAVGHFASVADAIAATEDALSARPSAVELIDRTILELSRRKIEFAALGSILDGRSGRAALRDLRRRQPRRRRPRASSGSPSSGSATTTAITRFEPSPASTRRRCSR